MNLIYEKHRIYEKNEDGKLMIEATFPFHKEGVVVVNHTYVDPSLRGQGIASQLMHEVCKHAKQLNYKVVATCPYAVVWFKKHREYDNLIDKEAQAGLDPECQI